MVNIYPSLSQASWLRRRQRRRPLRLRRLSRTWSRSTAASRDQVQPGMLVIANFAPVGQIISVGPTTSIVRLISDTKTIHRASRASIKRIIPGNPVPQIIAESCEVEGLGDGRLFCRSVSAYNGQTPLPGDIVVVNKDSTWRSLDGARIGEIEKADRIDQGTLRFELTIRSYADLPNLRQVWVVASPALTHSLKPLSVLLKNRRDILHSTLIGLVKSLPHRISHGQRLIDRRRQLMDVTQILAHHRQ